MNCRHFKQILIDVAREELSASEDLESIRIHAENCPRCRNDFKQQQALSLILDAIATNSRKNPVSSTLPENLRKAFVSHHQERFVTGKQNQASRFWAVAAVLLIVAVAAALSHQVTHSGSSKTAALLNPLGTTHPSIQEDGSEQVATEFIPLMEGDASWDTMQMVRVRMPRSALLQLGLPMNETREDESILADVLVGDDGMPYAIRFINHEKF
jgi:predicted anti-sigma-YlaC factor YlaD